MSKDDQAGLRKRTVVGCVGKDSCRIKRLGGGNVGVFRPCDAGLGVRIKVHSDTLLLVLKHRYSGPEQA